MRDDQKKKEFGQNKPRIKRRRKRKSCFFLENKFEVIDYKDVNLLRRFINDRGKILPRRNTGVSSKWQRRLQDAIKRARYIGLLPHCID